jgi:hypothetical protein
LVVYRSIERRLEAMHWNRNIIAFWVEMPYILVDRYHVTAEIAASIAKEEPENGDRRFFRNVGNDVPNYTASYLKRQ